MADDAPPADAPGEAPVDNAPLRERAESKTWKTRMEAFVELAKVSCAARLHACTPARLHACTPALWPTLRLCARHPCLCSTPTLTAVSCRCSRRRGRAIPSLMSTQVCSPSLSQTVTSTRRTRVSKRAASSPRGHLLPWSSKRQVNAFSDCHAFRRPTWRVCVRASVLTPSAREQALS